MARKQMLFPYTLNKNHYFHVINHPLLKVKKPYGIFMLLNEQLARINVSTIHCSAVTTHLLNMPNKYLGQGIQEWTK